MKNIKKVIHIIKFNGKMMFQFEMIYRMFSIILFTPLLMLLFNSSLKLTGYKYITIENLYKYLSAPVTIAILIAIVLLLSFFCLIEICGNIFIVDQSYQYRKTDIDEVFKFALLNSLRAFSIRNIFMAFIILFMVLALNIGVTTTYFKTIILPDFITALLNANHFLKIFVYIGVAAVILFFSRWLYCFQYFTIERCHFVKACKKSSSLNSKNKIKDLLSMILLEAVCGVLFVLIAAIFILIVVLIYRALSGFKVMEYVLAAAIVIVVNILVIVSVTFSMPVICTCISVMYYKNKMSSEEELVHCKNYVTKKHHEHKKAVIFLLIAGGIICSVYVYIIATGKLNFNVEYVKTMEVTAHRGASVKYPENSMSAFEGAVKHGADWIELDVQQTRDGKVIVMHDSNSKRTTGVNKNIWEMNYADVEKLDCGKWFSSKYEGEEVPSLEKVIKFAAAKDIKLNIEIKPTGHEKDFEKSVVDIINDNDFNEDCVVTSQSYSSLKKVKDYDKDITTVYVMSIAYGSIVNLKAADNFSVKSYYVTEDMVSNIHNAGKQIYVWTLNNEKTIDRMIKLNVDNIITDNIDLAKRCIYEDKTDNNLIKKTIALVIEKAKKSNE